MFNIPLRPYLGRFTFTIYIHAMRWKQSLCHSVRICLMYTRFTFTGFRSKYFNTVLTLRRILFSKFAAILFWALHINFYNLWRVHTTKLRLKTSILLYEPGFQSTFVLCENYKFHDRIFKLKFCVAQLNAMRDMSSIQWLRYHCRTHYKTEGGVPSS